MNTAITPHTVTFGRNKTSISLEEAFWIGLCKIARRKGTTASKIVQKILTESHRGNLSSAVRVFVLNQLHLKAAGRKSSVRRTAKSKPPARAARRGRGKKKQ